MGNIHPSLKLCQLGEQSALGTAVAATWQLSVPVEISDADVVETPVSVTGAGQANPGYVRQAIERASSVSIPSSPITAEDLKTLMHFALDVTPDTDGIEIEAVDVLTRHAWTINNTEIPSILGATFETRMTDGTTDVDYEFADVFFPEFSFSWDRGQFLQFGATGVGQARADSTLTDLSTPFPHNDLAYFPASRAQLYIDDGGGNHGTTEKTGILLGGSVTVDTGLLALRTADGNSDLSYGAVVCDTSRRSVSLELKVLATAGAAEVWRDELANAEAGDLRNVRVKFNGPAAATGSTGRTLLIDVTGRHVPGSYLLTEMEDGQAIVTMQIDSHADPADPMFFSISVDSSDTDNAPAST